MQLLFVHYDQRCPKKKSQLVRKLFPGTGFKNRVGMKQEKMLIYNFDNFTYFLADSVNFHGENRHYLPTCLHAQSDTGNIISR